MTDTSHRVSIEIGKIIATSLAGALATSLVAAILGSFSDSPGLYALIMVPLLLAVTVVTYRMVVDRRVLLGGGYGLFLAAYCSLFALAVASDLFTYRRTLLTGFSGTEQLGGNFFGWAGAGDWRYLLIPAAPEANPSLIAIALPPAPIVELRRHFSALIRQAIVQGAAGVAFDFYLDRNTETPMDSLLCRQLDAARESNVPVFFGQLHEETDGRIHTLRPPPSLERCLPVEQRATAAGYLEGDNKVRMVPVFLQARNDQPSLSYRIASVLRDDIPPVPPKTLLQFTQPADEPKVHMGVPTLDDVEVFKERFWIVGSSRANDVFDTPYGELPGVMVHLYAANSIVNEHFVTRLGPLWSYSLLFSACVILAVFQLRSRPLVLIGMSVLFSLIVVVSAAIAVHFFLVWINIAYPLVAIAALTLILLSGSMFQVRRHRRDIEMARDGPVVGANEPFDLFLSHNGTDKPLVRELAEELKKQGIKVWLDEWELAPGSRWQDALEEIVTTVKSAAILVGPDGLGPWEEMEMRTCLQQAVKRKMPVFAVLLPGAGQKPKLPGFLNQFTWLDLRRGFTKRGIERLIWSVTGEKPAYIS